MTNGKLAAAQIPAITKTTVYTVQPCRYADISTNLVNISENDLTVKVYFTTDAVPADVDIVAFNVIIPANGGTLTLEDKMSPGEKIVVEASAAGLVTRVSGVLYSKTQGE